MRARKSKEPTDGNGAPAGASRRWPLKRLLLLAIVLAVLGGLLYTTTEDFRERLRHGLVELVDSRIAGEFSIERIEGSPWTRLDLLGIQLATDGETVARIESIGLEPVWRALLRRRFRLARIVLESPRLTLRIDSDGGANWTRAFAPIDLAGEPDSGPSEAEILIPAFIEAIAIRNGAARIETPDRRPFEIIDLDAELRIDSRSNLVTIEQATIASPASSLAVRGEIEPGDSVRLVVEPLRLGAADLSILSDSLAELPEITGRLSLDGPLHAVALDGRLEAPDAHARLSGQVDLESPSAETAQIRARFESRSLAQTLPGAGLAGEARGEFSLEGGSGRFELALGHAGGEMRATGSFDLHAPRQIEASLEFSDFDPAAIRPGRPEWAGRLNGRGRTTILLPGEAPVEGQAHFSLDPSRIGDVELEALTLDAQGRDPAYVIETLDVVTRQGRASVSGSIDLRPTGPVSLHGRFQAKELAPLLAIVGLEGAGSLTGDVTLEGIRREARLRGRLAAGRLGLEDVVLDDASLVFDLDVDLMHPDRLPSASQIDVSVGRLSAFDQRVALELAFSTDSTSSTEATASNAEPVGPDRPAFALALEARALAGEDEAAPPIRRLLLEARGAIDGQQIDADLLQAELEIPTSTWKLQEATRLRIAADEIEIGAASLHNGTASIDVVGRLSRKASQDLHLEAHSLSNRALADLFLDDFEPGGRIDLSLDVRGSAEAPTISARVESTDLDLGFGELAIDRALLILGVDGGAASLALSAHEAEQTRLEATARIPVELSWHGPLVARIAGPLEADARCGDLDLRLIQPLVSGTVDELSGRLRCALRVSGPLDDLDPSGTLELLNVTARPRASEVPIREGTATLELDRHHVVLRELSALAGRSPQGAADKKSKTPDARLRAEGEWEHDGQLAALFSPSTPGPEWAGPIEGKLSLEHWPVIDTRSYKLLASGEIIASGRLRTPRLEGSIEVDEGLLRPTLEFLDQGPPPRDPTIQFEEAIVGPEAPSRRRDRSEFVSDDQSSIYESLALDIHLDAGRDLWIRHPEAAIELAGDVRVRKREAEALTLEGEIEADRGWFRLQGRRFNMVDGRVVFGGRTPIDPSIDVLARYKVPDYAIDAHIEGPASSPVLTLESDPALEQADILAVLIFGRPLQQLSESEQESVGETASSMAATYGMTTAGRTLASALGLDDAGIYIEEISQERAEIGTYLGRSTFVSVAQQFGIETGQELTVEYEFWPGWSIVASTSSNDTSSVDLFWKVRY